jgi:REP element-mobilizing transposase RayT
MDHRRRSIRLPGCDYAGGGAFFVTLCAAYRRVIFGSIENDRMQLNPLGGIVESCWNAIPVHFPHVAMDHFVVMPNHLHGIIMIGGARHAVPLQEGMGERFGFPRAGALSTILRSFKSATTRQAHQGGEGSGPLWQRNYYEHVIRDEVQMDNIREYIIRNPRQWALDRENPLALRSDDSSDQPWKA